MEDKGAYLITTNTSETTLENYMEPSLFIFLRVSTEQIKKSLPLSSYNSNDKNNEKTYIGAIFENGMDYIASHTYESIQSTLQKHKHIDLLNSNYEECLCVFPGLTNEQYVKQLEFSKRQLSRSFN